MGSGIDGEFRKRFLARLQDTRRFWELSGLDYMFIQKDFHAGIGTSILARPDETEQWPEPDDPYPYVSCLANHDLVADMVQKHVQESPEPIFVFPVNRYAWGIRIDGPYKHPIGIIKSFTPRESSNHWIHSWDWFNSGQCFFVGADASWALYTPVSTDPESADFLMADMPVLHRLTAAWPDMVNHIYRSKEHKRSNRKKGK